MLYRNQPAVIYRKFNQTDWFGNTLGYGLDRYSAIEKRMIECFRYVACGSSNVNTHSYEFSGIIRDVGSVFGSVLDTLVKKDNTVDNSIAKGGRLNITHYKKWLIRTLPTIHLASVELDTT